MNHHPPGRGRSVRWSALAVLTFAILIACSRGPAQTVAFKETHDRSEGAQPRGVSLELKFPQTHFYQGEVIPVTALFQGTTKEPYRFWAGAEQEELRPTDLGFRAISEAGEPVVDTVRYRMPEGPDYKLGGKFVALGHHESTVQLNRWLRFDRPGKYLVYGWARRVVPAPGREAKSLPDPQPDEMVSRIMTLQIDPLTPAHEKELLAAAAKDLAGEDEAKRREASLRLRFLQTPAAREMLMAYLGEWKFFDPDYALEEALDPEAGGKRMVEAVAAGRVAISMTMLRSSWFYRYSDAKRGDPVSATKKEVIEAAKASLRERPWDASARQNTLTLFLEERSSGYSMGSTFMMADVDPRTRAKDPRFLATLVERQMELNDQQGHELITGEMSDEERLLFLPLVRRLANAPTRSLLALPVLAKLAPAEARKLIVDDILHPPLHYIEHWNPAGTYDQISLRPLLCLPATSIPELDDALRYRFAHQDEDWAGENGIETALALTLQYGSPALLTEVRRECLPHVGNWACSLQEASLLYLLRCDPPAGVAALKQALASRKGTGCYKSTLDLLFQQWTDEAWPLVVSSLDDEYEGTYSAAVRLLVRHPINPLPTEKLVATAERLSKPPYTRSPPSAREPTAPRRP